MLETGSGTPRGTGTGSSDSARRRDPVTWRPVVARVKDRRRRRSRCSLYSVGPSCGSASSLVMLVYSVTGPRLPALAFGGVPFCCVFGELVDPPGGVAHGEDTRGGSGSKVKMEAISVVVIS
jgi:hypothetical protein